MDNILKRITVVSAYRDDIKTPHENQLEFRRI